MREKEQRRIEREERGREEGGGGRREAGEKGKERETG